MATTPNYDINYDDKRFTDVKTEEKQTLTDNEKLYGDWAADIDSNFDKQIAASKNWEKEQTRLQNEQTDFAIQKIEQERAQAEKDYTKEQSGAYVDWQKQSNQYGANAEQMAAQGLANTGYSESSQVAMYTAYQNRMATARQAFEITKLNFTNAIKEAQLQNSSILAEIAYKAQQEQLTYTIEALQQKNQLLSEKTEREMQIKSFYSTEYQRVLDQINTENALAEQVRQANLDAEYRQAQLKQQREIADAQLAQQKKQAEDALAEEQRQFNILHPADTDGSSPKKDDPIIKTSNNKTKTAEKTAELNSRYEKSISDASKYIEALIASGASKDKVANAIAIARRDGAITAKQAQTLNNRFAPRGIQY